VWAAVRTLAHGHSGRRTAEVPSSSPWAARSELRVSVRRVHGIDAALVMACPFDCAGSALCLPNTHSFTDSFVREFAHLHAAEARALPAVLATNVLLRHSETNRGFVLAWLQMALQRPVGFCATHVQDQAALSLLAHNHTRTLVNLCAFRATRSPSKRADGPGNCHRQTKNAGLLLRELAAGRYTLQPTAGTSALDGC